MTDTEAQDLLSLAADLAAAEQSAWQPRCVARAMAAPEEGRPVFTMQTWIDLDAASSPLLEGRLPETEEDLHAAVDAFRCGPVDLSAEEAVGLGLLMREAIEEAFAMSLPMNPPGDDAGGSTSLCNGFGDWLPIYAALIAQLGLSRSDARSIPVAEAYALLAADKRNRGWQPAGATYAQRDVIQPVTKDEGRSVKDEGKEAANG
jgi:hypothetical protein